MCIDSSSTWLQFLTTDFCKLLPKDKLSGFAWDANAITSSIMVKHGISFSYEFQKSLKETLAKATLFTLLLLSMHEKCFAAASFLLIFKMRCGSCGEDYFLLSSCDTHQPLKELHTTREKVNITKARTLFLKRDFGFFSALRIVPIEDSWVHIIIMKENDNSHV